MKARHLLFGLLAAGMLLAGCADKEAERAQARLDGARALVEAGRWDTAKVELDSIHVLYRQQVDVRRQAKALADSIVYLEAQRTLAYSDSVLEELLPQVDPLLKRFRYEKDDKYESNGQYVSRQLQTERNMERCYLQAYVGDNRVTRVKSYYYGEAPLVQQSVALQVRAEGAPESISEVGTCHSFEADGYYSILTMEDEPAIRLLTFVANHQNDRIRVQLNGTKGNEAKGQYVYYLSDNDKSALTETLQLAVMFFDIKRLEEAIHLANMQILKYEMGKE